MRITVVKLQKCLLLLLTMIRALDSLKISEFKVPEKVNEGEEVQLICVYDLQGGALYTLKWYRDEKEFFRLEPKANPKIQFFKVPGINVDEYNSNETSVILKNVNNLTSGTFSCEISAESTFQTVDKEKVMTVNSFVANGSAKKSWSSFHPLILTVLLAVQ